MPADRIVLHNARQHNLQGITVEIPHRRLTVITGPSGSGKSSLAFDTLYAEGQRRYIESLSTYAKQFLERMPRPAVDRVEGIAPAVAIEQKNPTTSSRSTVGTATEIYDYLRLLWARVGRPHCHHCGAPITVIGYAPPSFDMTTQDSPTGPAPWINTLLPGPTPPMISNPFTAVGKPHPNAIAASVGTDLGTLKKNDRSVRNTYSE